MAIWTFLLVTAFTSYVRAYFAITTASIGSMYVSVGIFSEYLNRNEAANRCREYGFEGLEDGGLSYVRYIGIVQKLQEISYAFSSTTVEFWVDFFRLDDFSDVWYETTFCWTATDRTQFNGNPPSGRNCAAVKFSNDFTSIEHQAIDCTKNLPFLCVKTELDLGPFKLYQEARPQEVPVDCKTRAVQDITNYEDCEYACALTYYCVAVTFDPTLNTCTHMEIESDQTAWVTYPLEFKNHVQHGAKNGTLVTYYSASTTSAASSTDGSLPDCGAVTITPAASVTTSRRSDTTSSTVSTASSSTSTPPTTIPDTEMSGDGSTVQAYTEFYYPPVIDIYETPVSWFEALRGCSGADMTLDKLYQRGYTLYRTTMMKQFLGDYNYTGSLVFWFGLFKPELNLGDDGWYRTNHNVSLCFKQDDVSALIADASDDDRCSVVRFTGLGPNDTADVYTESCTKRHSYYCVHKTDKALNFIEYNGWDFLEVPENGYQEFDRSVNTIQDCRDLCSHWMCVAWSYHQDQLLCYQIYANYGYGHLTYDIIRSSSYVTHGYKNQFQMTFHPDHSGTTLLTTGSFGQDSEHSHTFPTCNFTFSITTEPSFSTTGSQTTTLSYETTSTQDYSTTEIPAKASTIRTSTEELTISFVIGTPTEGPANPSATSTSTPGPATSSVIKSTERHAISSTAGKSTKRPATSTTSNFTLTSTYSSTTTSTCKRQCPCRNGTSYNSTEMEEVINEIVRNLTINRAETSKTRRELTCAEDSRQSSRVVGGLGIAVLSVVFAGIIILDLPRLMSLFG